MSGTEKCDIWKKFVTEFFQKKMLAVLKLYPLQKEICMLGLKM